MVSHLDLAQVRIFDPGQDAEQRGLPRSIQTHDDQPFSAIHVDIDGVSVPSLGAEILASIVFWFLLGYTMYAALYAGLGATVSRQEDLQSALMLPVILMLPGFFIAQAANEFPDSPIVVFGSFFPLGSLVMGTVAQRWSISWAWCVGAMLTVALSLVVLGRLPRRPPGGTPADPAQVGRAMIGDPAG